MPSSLISVSSHSSLTFLKQNESHFTSALVTAATAVSLFFTLSCASDAPKKEKLIPEFPAVKSVPQFSAEPVKEVLQILHTSDNESALLGSGAALELVKNKNVDAIYTKLGGVARAKSLTETLIQKSTGHSILLAAGDTMMPAPELKAQIGKKNAVASANNLLGYKASALGNHEFDLGEAFLAAFIQQATFPYLTATIRPKSGPLFEILVKAPELAKGTPWARLIKGRISPRARVCIDGAVVEEEGKIRCTGMTLGLIGATTERLRALSNISDAVMIDDTLEKVRDSIQIQVDELRKDGVNKIILLSHMQDIRKELKLVEMGLHGVDVIIAGGGDNRLANKDQRLFDVDKADDICEHESSCYPLVRMAQDSRPVLLVATDGQLKYVGSLNLSFDDQGVLVKFDKLTSKPWPVDDVSLKDLHANPHEKALSFEAKVRRYLSPLMPSFATTKVFLNGTRENIRNRETNLGNLTADAMLWASQKPQIALENEPSALAGVAFNSLFALRNAGGIRTSIGTVNAKTFQKEGGFIRPLDVQSSLRFNNALVIVKTTHKNLRRTFESALRGVGTARGSFPQVSANVRLTYFKEAPEQTHITENGNIVALGCTGARVKDLIISLKNGQKIVIVKDGITQDSDAKIQFTTLKYLAKGGDSYFPAGVSQVERLAVLSATEQSSFRDYIQFLEETGSWNEGVFYVDPIMGKPHTFHRILELKGAPENIPEACLIIP